MRSTHQNQDRGAARAALSRRIRGAIESTGLTQGEFGILLGVRRETVNRWMSDDGVVPTPFHLRGIARETGHEHEWLRTGKGKKRQQ